MQTWIRKHQLISYFILAYAIMFGLLFGYIFVRPGQPLEQWSPLLFVAVFSPTISAVCVSWVAGGMDEVKRTLSGFTRWNVGFWWYCAAAFLFLGPLAIALVYGALGNPVTGLQPGVTIPGLLGTVLFVFLSGPVGEEAGWRGFALPRLQEKHNALVASLILGVIHTCWHLPLFFLAGASQMSIPFPFYLALVTTLTVYYTWIYNNARGSLVTAVLAHFTFNLTGTLITGPLTLMPVNLFYMTASPLLLATVVVVVLIFGPARLSRKPAAELPSAARKAIA